MSFMAQQKTLSAKPGVFNYSGLSSVVFRRKLYVFYNNADQNGGWYNVLDRETNHWSGPFSFRKGGATFMSVAEYTTPVAVVWRGTLYAFFNGSGNNGTFWTSSTDGQRWAQVKSMSEAMGTPAETFAKGTSPSVTVLKNALYVVWNNVADNGTLRYTAWSDPSGNIVSPMDVTASGLSIRRQTSTALATFKDKLFLFFNGAGSDGTWMTTFSSSGWARVNPVTLPLAGSALDYTSPAACVSDDGRVLTLFWNGSANDGLWHTNTMNGFTWLPQMGLSQMIEGQSVLYKSSPSVAHYRGIPHILWVGDDANVWYSQGLTLSADDGDYNSIMKAILAGSDFTVVTADTSAIRYLVSQMQSSYAFLQKPADNVNESLGANIGWGVFLSTFIASKPILTPPAVVCIFSITTLAVYSGFEVCVDLSEGTFSFRRPPPLA
ncbi:hypothetical protein FPSE_04041 [Fusarium pseudograminearum CS3096]|uniref:Uncharacterized protein n=1 Tax=Fusarium pseudograminearum (strain CS3096) TaxID=1028729 RepID=K3UTQ9_FUSPC|nr:hypothetical protein FPSE_04041 [Fusarium pseudograminearum CS3096]EKJ75861.1 hypothetical protein FPSE_04041 [Fusarium pseudograminearum CS3096]KAF0642304.1 hypothetical protein FPSE5266_04041 [Fusarium pseudograminearum]